MSTQLRRSIVFHPAASVLLLLSVVFAAYMLFVFIIPALNVEVRAGSIDVWFLSVYNPVFLMFFASAGIALAILGWRVWLLYINPEERKSNGA